MRLRRLGMTSGALYGQRGKPFNLHMRKENGVGIFPAALPDWCSL